MQTLQKLSHKQALKLEHDHEAAAKAAHLKYVSDHENGITRHKNNEGFYYEQDGKRISNQEVLDRISKLVIPPAWEQVWICRFANGHIQATGYDTRSRKQYRYHALWNYLRTQTKFHKLLEFGKALPALRLQVEKDIAQKELNEHKVIATVISLMERTYIRIGNEDYQKQNGSYGLTTLQNRHVTVDGDKIKFSFKGKKGIFHSITLKNKKLAGIVKNCREIPGKELFQYYDAEGNRKEIHSGMVNEYIKTHTSGDFTAKDFRTWAGSLNILLAFKAMEEAIDDKTRKSNILAALDQVSAKLGNTRTVCRNYYVHPGIIRLYEEDKLNKHLKELNAIEKNDDHTGLASEEKVLMKLLENHPPELV